MNEGIKEKFYVTTSIAYVNAAPHIGFAMEVVQEDVLARYKSNMGVDVYSLTGTDEHGVKLFQVARDAGTDPQSLADSNAEKFKKLKDALSLSYDYFVRTTDADHKEGAQKLWSAIDAAGDLYKDKYSGYYCVGCEAFITEKDLEDGKCPIHKKEPNFLEEENYYFKLSKYQDKLTELIESDELRIVPEARKNEILSLIKSGLKDVSFSRPRNVLPWGVDVPGDDDQVMYVWCDALSNYITAIGYANNEEKFSRYWPCDVHIIGKDILRFHAAIWPAMLLSAGIELPKAIYVHGFITSEGHKMSKSIGNVVDPFEYVDEFGQDALRYYLTREIPTTDDGDFSRERFINLYNTDLANNVGNLVNRVVTMTHKYFEGKIPDNSWHDNIEKEVTRAINDYVAGFESFDLREALVSVISLVDYANKYIDDEKPWILAKEGKNDELAKVMKGLLEVILRVALLLEPFMPNKANDLLAIFEDIDIADCFIQKEEILKVGMPVEKVGLLFPKIEVEE